MSTAMRAPRLPTVLLLVASTAAAQGQSTSPHASMPESRTPLYTNLGTLHHPIRTASAEAQRYFDQGLRLVYAFNHEEAINSFREGVQRDSACAMCYWGIALALGPNINAAMDSGALAPARAAVAQAQTHAGVVTASERAYIEAMAVRYGEGAATHRAALDSAYATAMRALTRRYPADDDAAVLFAESMLDLRPWDQWTLDGRPQAGTLEVVATLERVLRRNAHHPGACHYYIHTVEASSTPQRALPCAERLPQLMPGAGHLVHMPAHIYMRLGRYADATRANEHASHTDEEFLEGRHPTGIYPIYYYAHNLHFLWAAASMEGRSGDALRAARQLSSAVPVEVVKTVPSVEFFVPTPLFALVRFGKWSEVLQEPAPPSELRYSRGMWHYARGFALARTGRLPEARAERDSVARIATVTPRDQTVGLNSAAALLGIASNTLSGELASKQGDADGAVRYLDRAITAQDSLRYDEPPAWYYPVRQSLGAVLLAAGRPTQAEAIYRADLKRNPANGWSLYGLEQSLKAQRRGAEAATIEKRRAEAWARADVELVASRY